MKRIMLSLVAAALLACDTGISEPAMEEGGFVTVAAGGEHTCAISQAGTLYCWGGNRSGQIGTAYGPSSAHPVAISTGVRFAAVTAGTQHGCALDTAGTLYCWGGNQRGQLGNASRINQGLPVPIEGLRFAHISAGSFHTCGITFDGFAYCWGAAGQSQVGGVPSEDVLQPRLVSGLRFSSISAGGFHTCALDTAGRAYCWGANHYGQLGDGSTTNRPEPRPVVGGGTFRALSSGYTHTCAVRIDLTPVCWGSSEYGELGTGGVAVPGLPGATEPLQLHSDERATDIVAGYYASCLVAETTWGWCWGRGEDGQLGTGATWDSWTPQYVTAGVPASNFTAVNIDFVMISMGLQHACGLTERNVLHCWGRGNEGQLGAGSIRYSPLPVRVSAAR